ncbi:MAG: hypothetical protein AAFZ74_10735 [Pseudomonadota bacterium]
MSAKDRTPPMRLLALAAFLLAAGLLSLRAYDLFGSVKSESVGNSVERELTYLLEPITGSDRVRVSMTGEEPKSVLIMVDGDIATDLRPLRTRIENILMASVGFDAETDTLTLTQFPFARGVGGTLTPFQIAELTGLGLLSLILLITTLSPQRVASVVAPAPAPAPVRAEPLMARTSRLPASLPPDPNTLHEASTLAETHPKDTAKLVKGWMSYAED